MYIRDIILVYSYGSARLRSGQHWSGTVDERLNRSLRLFEGGGWGLSYRSNTPLCRAIVRMGWRGWRGRGGGERPKKCAKNARVKAGEKAGTYARSIFTTSLSGRRVGAEAAMGR